jgi:uncharacterized protein (TIGR02996 family)
MSDRNAFLRAICETPADDAPHLVFADWLNENGESERAEFIRVQCELAIEGGNKELIGRQRILLPLMRIFLRRSIPKPATAVFWHIDTINPINDILQDAPALYLRCGFVAEVACPLADWLAHGKAICEQHPVERVRITDRRPLNLPADWNGEYTLRWIEPDNGRVTRPYHLPKPVFRKLKGLQMPGQHPRVPWYFQSVDAAIEGASRAALTWGRDEAGLPPLREQE